MKTLSVVAGIILMAVGIYISFTILRLHWGWLTIPASIPTIFGYRLYLKGKEL